MTIVIFQLATAWMLLLRGASQTRQLENGAFVFQLRFFLKFGSIKTVFFKYSCFKNEFGEGQICRTGIQEAASFSDARDKCASFDGVIYNPFISLAAFTDLLEVDIQNPASVNLNSFWISGFAKYEIKAQEFCQADTNLAIFPVVDF